MRAATSTAIDVTPGLSGPFPVQRTNGKPAGDVPLTHLRVALFVGTVGALFFGRTRVSVQPVFPVAGSSLNALSRQVTGEPGAQPPGGTGDNRSSRPLRS